jgi:hypothetical protein
MASDNNTGKSATFRDFGILFRLALRVLAQGRVHV